MNFNNRFQNFFLIYEFKIFNFLLANFGQRFRLITIQPNDSRRRIKGRISRANLEELFVSMVQAQYQKDVPFYSLHERFIKVFSVVLVHQCILVLNNGFNLFDCIKPLYFT